MAARGKRYRMQSNVGTADRLAEFFRWYNSGNQCPAGVPVWARHVPPQQRTE